MIRFLSMFTPWPVRWVGTAAALLLLLGVSAPLTAEPVTVAHRWGETVVPELPRRIVSLSYTGIDTLIALDLVPVAYRAWFGGDERGLWPWAADRLTAGAAPLVLRGEIDAETVARLRPDLVEAMYSGIGRAQYAALSQVTAVLPPSEGQSDFAATWDGMLHRVGAATGRADQAEARIAEIRAKLGAVRDAHPDWRGRTAVVALPDGPLIYTADDPRMALLRALGFRLPDAARDLARGGFYFELDRELTAPLEADVLIWLDWGAGVDGARSHPLHHTLRAVREGREIVADRALSAALSYASPLSIPYALERLVPLLEAALSDTPNS